MTPCFLAIASATASPPVISTAQLLEYWAPLHDPNSRHTNTHTNRVHIIVRIFVKLNNNDERLLSTWTIDTAHIVSTDEVTNCSHRRHENNHTHRHGKQKDRNRKVQSSQILAYEVIESARDNACDACALSSRSRRLWSLNKQRQRLREFWTIDTELYLTGEHTGSHVSRLAVLLLWSVRMRPVLLRFQGEELDHYATALYDLPRVCAHRLGHHARPNRTGMACLSGT